jgi:hypothetical protein
METGAPKRVYRSGGQWEFHPQAVISRRRNCCEPGDWTARTPIVVPRAATPLLRCGTLQLIRVGSFDDFVCEREQRRRNGKLERIDHQLKLGW